MPYAIGRRSCVLRLHGCKSAAARAAQRKGRSKAMTVGGDA
jgi:hypothetical protein